jgi:hypothetical protein
VLKLMPEEAQAIESKLHVIMQLMTNMYHSAELNNQNSGRLNGIRVRIMEIANLMDMDMGEPCLSKRTPKDY